MGHLPRDGPAGIDAGLVRRLVAAQLPHWRDLDAGTWARAGGWALWKALLGLVDDPDSVGNRRTVDRVVAEHRSLA